MSRVRQALRCHAQRSHGRGACGNYAVTGAVVCRMHGGAAPQVRAAADRRAQRARIEAMLTPSIAQHRALLAHRVALVARILNVPPEQAAATYTTLAARWALERDPAAGGLLAADERELLYPRREDL